MTTPISKNVDKNVVESDIIESSSQLHQSDYSKTTSHPNKITKISTGDKSHLETTKAKASMSQKAKPPSPTPDKREDLTALKALDVLLRKYDRRSTPTNDLGKIFRAWNFQLNVAKTFWWTF